MQSLEAIFEAAVQVRVIPGAIVAASSTDGSYKYAKSFGYRSLKDESSLEPLELDALYWMGSCTKLLTAIAALQCVEQGHFTLDEDVTRLLPELKDVDVKIPAENATDLPTLERNTRTITLRHFLLHTSGLSYTKFGDLSLPLLDRCLTPLNFKPSEGFIYGTGVDFVGFMVERVSGMSLEEYINKYISAPLGINSICFRPKSDPELFKHFTDVSLRKEKTGPVEFTPMTIWPIDTEGDSGGSGAYATLIDYQKILHSITSDDGVLLSSEMVEEMFRPDMTPAVRESIRQVLKNESTNNIYGGVPLGTEVAYSIGGMVVLEDLPGRRPKGTVHWGGLLNVFFWMDRTTGISGIFGTQVFPAGDPKCLGLFAEFERQTYEAFRERASNKMR